MHGHCSQVSSNLKAWPKGKDAIIQKRHSRLAQGKEVKSPLGKHKGNIYIRNKIWWQKTVWHTHRRKPYLVIFNNTQRLGEPPGLLYQFLETNSHTKVCLLYFLFYYFYENYSSQFIIQN